MPDPYTYPGFDYDLSKLSPQQIMEQLAGMDTAKAKPGQPAVLMQPRAGTQGGYQQLRVPEDQLPQSRFAGNPPPVSSPVATAAEGPESSPMPKQMTPQSPQMGAMGGGSAGASALDYGAQIQQLLQAGPGNDPDLWAKQVTGRRIAQGNREQEDQARQQQGISGFSQVPTIENLLRANFGGSSQYNWAPSDDQRAFAARQQLEQLKLASSGQTERDRLEAARTDASTQRDFQSREADLGRKNQLEIANVQAGTRDEIGKKIEEKLLSEAWAETGGNAALTAKLVKERKDAFNRGQPGAAPIVPGGTGPTDPVSQAQELLSKMVAADPQTGKPRFGNDDQINAAAKQFMSTINNPQTASAFGDLLAGGGAGDPAAVMEKLGKLAAYNILSTNPGLGTAIDVESSPGRKLGLEMFEDRGSGAGKILGRGLNLLPGFTVPFQNKLRLPDGRVVDMSIGDRPSAFGTAARGDKGKEEYALQASQYAKMLEAMVDAQKRRQGR